MVMSESLDKYNAMKNGKDNKLEEGEGPSKDKKSGTGNTWVSGSKGPIF